MQVAAKATELEPTKTGDAGACYRTMIGSIEALLPAFGKLTVCGELHRLAQQLPVLHSD